MNNDIRNTTDMFVEYLEYIQDDTRIKRTPLGFNKSDTLFNGGLPNGLITLGAIPSIGKTTFMLQVADNMASLDNTKVLFFSLEMSRYDLITKCLSRQTFQNENLTNYSFDDLISNDEAIDYGAILETYEPIANNLYLIDNIYDIRDIEAYISHFRDDNPNENVVIFIDYLQYVLCGNNANDKQAIDIITKRLKELSKALGITIVVISSLNRANYNGTITMESFKESGSIEYTSDILMGLEYTNTSGNDRDYEANKNPRKITLKVIKNRYGACGKVNFDFNTKYNAYIER